MLGHQVGLWCSLHVCRTIKDVHFMMVLIVSKRNNRIQKLILDAVHVESNCLDRLQGNTFLGHKNTREDVAT